MAHGPIDLFRHITGHRGFDYDKITDGLYIGTNMCCQYGFSKELLHKGVRADISLEEDRTDAPNGVNYFLWLPTEDGKPPGPKEMEIGVQFLTSLIRNNVITYVHCRNGHGRAPTLVAAYLISQGRGVREAIDYLVARRHVIHPTELQVRALEAFKAGMK